MLLDSDLIASGSELIPPEKVPSEWGLSGLLKRKILVGLDLRRSQLRVIEYLGIGIKALSNFPLPNGESAAPTDFICVVLNLAQNNLRVIEGLEDCPRLRVLNLSINQLTVMQGFDRLTNLCVLDLSQNMFQSISGLDHLRRLQELNLSMNNLTSLNGLAGLDTLRRLDVSGNMLESLHGLEDGATSMTHLIAHHNRISDLGPLATLASLEQLDLCSNAVSGLQQLDEQISQLPKLSTLNLRDNPVASERTYRLAMLKKPNITDLDCQIITPEIRDRVLRNVIQTVQRGQVETVRAEAKAQYEKHLKQEKARVADALAALKQKQEQIQLSYANYAAHMNDELHGVLGHLEDLQGKEGRLRARDLHLQSVVKEPAVGPATRSTAMEDVNQTVLEAVREEPELWLNQTITKKKKRKKRKGGGQGSNLGAGGNSEEHAPPGQVVRQETSHAFQPIPTAAPHHK